MDFSRKAADLELFEVWILKINDRVATFNYYLKKGNRLSLIRSDFDLDFKYYSPGINLTFFLLKDLFERGGVWEYDMGGEAYAYKLEWTDKIREHIDITVGSGNIVSSLLMLGRTKVLPFIRPLKGGHGCEK